MRGKMHAFRIVEPLKVEDQLVDIPSLNPMRFS